jgi:PTH1 family peptidyl-tRNA hydrolase
VIFAKPMTYMNNSGQAVSLIVQKFGVSPQDLCVVYDDLNLDIGMLRLRKTGSDGGHNGIKSIIRHLSTQDFPRLRVGIGQVEGDWMDHVLTDFSADEREYIDWAIPCAADAVETFVTEGIQTAMNRFNGRVPAASNS